MTGGTKDRSLFEDGEFVCQQEICTLQAKARHSVIMVQEGQEEINLTGSQDKLTGKLTLPGKLSSGKEAIFNMTIKLSK